MGRHALALLFWGVATTVSFADPEPDSLGGVAETSADSLASVLPAPPVMPAGRLAEIDDATAANVAADAAMAESAELAATSAREGASGNAAAGPSDPDDDSDDLVPPTLLEHEAALVDFLFTHPKAPIVRLDAAAVDSIGTMISERNAAVVERVDAAYRAGEYGPPGSKEAKADALAAFIFASSTAFDFFLEMAMQHEVIYSTGEDDLRVAFTERFRNPGLYPIINLRDARAGFGRFCLLFEVDDPNKREISVSGEKMKSWTEELELGGERTRVVNIDMKTLSHDRVHVVYTKNSGATVSVHEVVEAGQKIRVITMDNIVGQYVRKFGFHRPAAVVIWRALPDGIHPPPPDKRFLGSAIYFPSLTLELPWFLPNIGFHDLRQFDYPEPVLTIETEKKLRSRNLDWLRFKDNSRIHDWEGESQVPVFVNERYPDR
ncbi:MAG: hypothetical protein KC591_08280 [Gemmatimonadetes bacterium]|nr:hypothetical protein [Gemmatimonadota bacterium]